MSVRFAVLLGSFGLVTCASPTQPGLVQVRTSATIVSAGAPDSSRVRFTVTNAGLSTVYVTRCGDQVTVVVEQWSAGTWTQYSGGYCVLSFYAGPVTLEPGQSVEGIRSIGAAGRFRLRVGVQTDMAAPPDWSSTSNPFDVR